MVVWWSVNTAKASWSGVPCCWQTTDGSCFTLASNSRGWEMLTGELEVRDQEIQRSEVQVGDK